MESVLDKLEGMTAQHNYTYACQYMESHSIDDSDGQLDSSDTELVMEHGASAWHFTPGEGNSGVVVRDGTEIEFSSGENSLLSNIQFPNEQRVYYYEVRLSHVSAGTNVAIGIAMKSYPPLRLVGWARNSIAYHSGDGCVYYSHPLDKCRQAKRTCTSDTVGVGWRPRSGKAFFAINGAIICHIRTPWARKRLYPAVSADGPCTLSVNMGTRAFVLSHANMRYWAVAPPEGTRLPPPLYQVTPETELLADSRPPDYNDHHAAHTAIEVGADADDEHTDTCESAIAKSNG
ncbi:Protein ssh4, partial [Coemansia sp. RSA 2320]